MKLFIDTWGWLTLRDKKESRHKEVKDFYSRFRDRNGIIYTSDYVIDETITLLFRRLPFKTAKGSLARIDKAIKEGYRLSHNKFHCVIGRRRITIQPSPSSLVQFNM